MCSRPLERSYQYILARSDDRESGLDLKQDLDRMIASCGSTLKDLHTVMKKYREIGIDSEPKEKIRTFEDAKKMMKVNWRKVRWDMEKQSLQQYREKLRSHADAINILLNSLLWQVALLDLLAFLINVI